MGSNVTYRGPGDLPSVIPVFPLAEALLLPRGTMPLNIFEPRYLAMIDDALKGARLIGMIQPDEARGTAKARPTLFSVGCVGRITQITETGDGRYLISLTGVARFRLIEEMPVLTPYRQCRVSYPFPCDFFADDGAGAVDRDAVLETLAEFLQANDLKADWEDIEKAPTELLVNALCMMSPFGAAEKQAMLEAADLPARAEVLVAVTRFALAQNNDDDDTPLH
ncbi:MAG: LON peptidase substrate-binding domain-containing protein [Blastochloris sp.]|nr:LON peptidase substrate-binding domain-containing protein [Blastochloris sp.]